MNRNTQKDSPLFAEVNVGQRAAESRNRNDRRDKRFTFVKLTYPQPRMGTEYRMIKRQCNEERGDADAYRVDKTRRPASSAARGMD